MAISAIGGMVTAPDSSQTRGLSAMNSEDFLRILVTEMQNQDPFEPSDSADIINQVSQIRTIEQSTKLTDTLNLMTQQQRMGGASALIGKYVQAIMTTIGGTPMLQEGVVTGVRFSSDGLAVLELDTGEAVPIANVVRVTTLSGVEQPLFTEGASGDQDSLLDKSDTTQRRRDADKSWLNLGGWLRL